MTQQIDSVISTDDSARSASERIVQALEWLRDPSAGFEIRSLRRRSAQNQAGGYSRQFPPGTPNEEIARYAIDQEGPSIQGVYYGLNPRRPDMQPDDSGKIADVLHRRLLLVDIDSGAPPDSNATEDERENAHDLARSVWRSLKERTGATPLSLDSGNGIHLIYLLENLDNDGRDGVITQVIKQALLAIEAKYRGAGGAKADPINFDGPRIARLPGILNRKGEHSEKRPHRWAGIIGLPCETPAGWVPITLAHLQALAAEAPVRVQPQLAWEGSQVGPKQIVGVNPFVDGKLKATAAPEPLSNIERASRYMGKMPEAISGQKGHDATFSVACNVGCGFDLSQDQCYDLMWREYNPRCVPPWSPEELRHKVESAYETESRRGWILDEDRSPNRARTIGSGGEGGRTRGGQGGRFTTIRLDGDDLAKNIDLAMPLLCSRPDLYVRGSLLVNIIPGTSSESPVITPIATVSLQEALSRAAYWIRITKAGNERPADPPKNVVDAIMCKGQWPGMRHLQGVFDAPVILVGGEICDKQGYHAAAEVYYHHAKTYPAVPDKPKPAEVIQALKALLYVIQDFPFASPGDRAVVLAHIFAMVARPAMPDAPIPAFFYDANTQGTGKTMLAFCVVVLATGRRPAVNPVPYESEETRKVITALGLKGERAVIFDNIDSKRQFGNGNIDMALTSTKWEDRQLGQSKMVSVPMHIVWAATGNNIQIKGDLARRVVRCRLETALEHPERRLPGSFTIDKFQEYVVENQPRLLVAALTILRAHALAGYPRDPSLPLMGSYEAFDRICRAPILWAAQLARELGEVEVAKSIGDPLSTAETEKETDPQMLMGSAILAGLNTLPEIIHNRGLSVREIIAEVEAHPDKYSDLREAILAHAPGRNNGMPNTMELGKVFNRIKSRIFGGLRLASQPGGKGILRWKLERVPSSEGCLGGLGWVDSNPTREKFGQENNPTGRGETPNQPTQATLTPGEAWRDDPHELEERAGILQFDGVGMGDEEAELHARRHATATAPASRRRRPNPDGPKF